MMLRTTIILAVAAAASAALVPSKFNLTAGPPTPKDARLLAWQNTTATKLAIAAQWSTRRSRPRRRWRLKSRPSKAGSW